MCGLTLYFSSSAEIDDVSRRLVAMERVQAHRGPDGRGAIVEPAGRGVLGIGQQRLSILDLSPAGSQPMVSPCGRYVLSYNGEIYNYRELAAELGDDPIVAMSSGDTAVLLASLVRWGPDAFRRLNGMWALAFFDRHESRVLLSRDRLGVKPLYFALARHTLVMASEIKGVLAGSAGRQFGLNRDIVARYLVQSLVSAQSETFFDGIEAFPAASYAQIDLNAPSISIEPKQYWRHPFEQPEHNGAVPDADEIRELFLDSVRLRLRSDVPVGVMLSGGLDSSSILAAAAKTMPGARLQALSVVSRDPETSEEPFIDRMTAHVGCDILKVQSDDDPHRMWDELAETIWHFDHPVLSFSNVAHRRVIGLGREAGLIVLLTGQGSDEQMGGYNKFLYFYLQDRLRRGKVKGPASMLAGCLWNRTILPEFSLAAAKRYIPFLRGRLSQGWIGSALGTAKLLDSGLGSSYEEREWLDLKRFSLPALLTSEDRMSMAHSCEMRTPFLDYRLVEALARVPAEAKLARGWTKHILREAMNDLLPSEIAWRRDKKGYSLPGRKWLTTALRPKVDEILNQPMKAVDLGLIDAAGARSMFADLSSGRSGVRYQDVLSIISLELWVRRFAAHIDGSQTGHVTSSNVLEHAL